MQLMIAGILILLLCAILALQIWIISGRRTAESSPPVPAPESQCFRITGVPPEWSEADLLYSLRQVDPSVESWNNDQVSIYPACCGARKTALLKVHTSSKFFMHIGIGDSKFVEISRGASDKKVGLLIDCHFHELTPLNTPKGDIIAE
jgi:hypothetical protein